MAILEHESRRSRRSGSRVSRGFVREAVLLGCLWLAISVAIDAPLMLFGGPMRMTVGQYLADIGAAYVIIPVITIGLGQVLERTARRDTASSLNSQLT